MELQLKGMLLVISRDLSDKNMIFDCIIRNVFYVKDIAKNLLFFIK